MWFACFLAMICGAWASKLGYHFYLISTVCFLVYITRSIWPFIFAAIAFLLLWSDQKNPEGGLRITSVQFFESRLQIESKKKAYYLYRRPEGLIPYCTYRARVSLAIGPRPGAERVQSVYPFQRLSCHDLSAASLGARKRLRSWLQSEHYWLNGFRLALFAGEQSALDQRVWNAFNTLGLSHWLVVSGGHLAFFVLALAWVLAKTPRKLGWKFRRGLLVAILVFACWFLGAEVSLLRAFAVVAGFATLSFFFPRLGTFSHLEKTSLIGILFFLTSPSLAFENGFLLSFAGASTLCISTQRFRALEVSLVSYCLCLLLNLNPHPFSPLLNLLLLPLLVILVAGPLTLSFIPPAEAFADQCLQYTAQLFSRLAESLPVASLSDDAWWPVHLIWVLLIIRAHGVGKWGHVLSVIWPLHRLL